SSLTPSDPLYGEKGNNCQLFGLTPSSCVGDHQESLLLGLEEVIGVVEEVRGEKWDRFRDRYGDVGRDLVLHLGRTVCGMSIRELSQRAEIRYVSAATALRRFAARAREDREIAKLLRRAMSKLNNE